MDDAGTKRVSFLVILGAFLLGGIVAVLSFSIWSGVRKPTEQAPSEDLHIQDWRGASFQMLDSERYIVTIRNKKYVWDPSKDLITVLSTGFDARFRSSEGVIMGTETFTHGDTNYYFYDDVTHALIGLLFVDGEGQANVGAFLSINAQASCEKDTLKNGDSHNGQLMAFSIEGRSSISGPMKHISTIALSGPDMIDIRCMRNEFGDLYIMPRATSTALFGSPTMDGTSQDMFVPVGALKLRLDFSSKDGSTMAERPMVTLEKLEPTSTRFWEDLPADDN